MKLYFLSILVMLTLMYQPCAVSIQPYEAFNHLGTRTPYRFKANLNDSIINFPGCKPKKIWMMIRHGTRYPNQKDIESIHTILRNLKYDILLQHNLGKGNLTEEVLFSLEDWSSNLDIEKEKFLTLEGRDEMVLLAERMKKIFPGIIKDKYDNEIFLFRYTATERTQQSARYFANALFDQQDAKDVVFAPATKVDTVLRFYKHCDKWQKQVKKNHSTYKEYKAFEISEHMNKTLVSVSDRLGLTKILSLAQLKLMYKVCGYETAWSKYFVSPWCSAFDKEGAEVMQYYFDLKHYWQDGYGLELTYRQACLSVKHMFDNFSHEKNPKAVFFFAHSGTLLKIIGHLGLYKPESHLSANVFQKDRPWKTTDIDCFATNLAFVLFDCQDRDYVLTMHQEYIIKMPSCDSELCPLDHLTEYFHDSIHDCDFSDMCSLDRNEEL